MANVTDERYAAGILVGRHDINTDNADIVVENCINLGRITAIRRNQSPVFQTTFSGGIVCDYNYQYYSRKVIRRCINAGYVFGNHAGGIHSYTEPEYFHLIQNCINVGGVKGRACEYGITGWPY